jgi:hypothetical protein
MLKYAAMGGNYYADGGGMSPEQGGMQQAPPPGAEQGQPQGGGDQQMQQVIQFVMQALQQGMPPEEIMKQLVEAGIPEDQAGQLVQAIMQKMQEQGGGGQGAPQEQMMEAPQGQEAAPQEMMEEEPPMGMYGGGYAYGGPTRNNSTYSGGISYANGGPYIPTYADHAYGGQYAAGGEAQSNQLIQQVAQMLQQGVKPEVVLQQLVQAKIPKAKAIKLIQMVAEQMQGAAAQQQQMAAPEQQMMNYGGPYIPLSNGGNSTNFNFGGPAYSKMTQYNHQGIVPAFDWMQNGGNVKQYKKGGEYEMSHSDIQDLINKGYKIQYL